MCKVDKYYCSTSSMVTEERLKQGLEDISASVAEPNEVERVECVSCSSLTLPNSINKYKASVVTSLNDRHAIEYYNRYAEEWVKKFSTFTNTSWVQVVRSDCKRLPYRKTYKCHYKYKDTKISPMYTKISQNLLRLVGGPQDCQSHIIFKFTCPRKKKSVKNKGSIITIIIDTSYCKKVHIQLYFLDLASGDKSWTQRYLHGVSGPPQDHKEPLLQLDELYYRYFVDGHTERTAKMVHLITLLCKYGNNDNVLSDQSKNPLMSYVMCIYRYYNKSCIKDHHNNIEIIMPRKQAEMEELGGLMRFHSQDMVTIITPTMKRVLSSCELDEVIISSTTVSQGPKVALFFIPSKIGALCFACVLHGTQEAYSKVFLTIKSVIEQDYQKKFKPKSIVIDDISSPAQRIAAEVVFQNSKVVIAPWCLCFHAWIWMCNSKSTNRRYWHEAMLVFHDIMYAADAESAHESYMKFVSKVGLTNLYFLKDYLEEIWKQYRLIIWWSSANNNLVVLSITLLQQFFVQKCASFNILHMCDIISALDKHFQWILLHAVDKKQPILKIHTKFLDKSELNSLKLELTSPRAFSVDSGFIKLRTDTWCCDCATGKKGLYCEHSCALIDVADLTVALSDDEKRLLKHIAGENDDAAAGVDGNCEEASKVHPTFTDGYYLFYLPMNINLLFTFNKKSIPLSLSGKESYNLIINDLINKYKLKEKNCDIQDEDKNKDVEVIIKSGHKSLEKPVSSTEVIDIVENLDKVAKRGPQKYTNRKRSFHVNYKKIEQTIDTESVQIQNNDLLEKSDRQNDNSKTEISFQESEELMNIESVNEETNNLFKEAQNIKEKTQEQHAESIDLKTRDSASHSKANLHDEIDLKMEIVCTEDAENDERLLEENRSQTFVDANSSVNNFMTEYYNALDNLRNEFKKFTDRLGPSASYGKLERIVQLTKEFSATRAELLGIKREPEDPSVD